MNIKHFHSKWMLALLTFTFTLAVHCYAEPFLPDHAKGWQNTTPFKAPTKRFLGKVPYETINWNLQLQGIYLKQKTFYDAVMQLEERGFMGYHASGHKFRVFQDIIKITLEEVLGLEFKKDFHFFRLPGDFYVNDHPSAYDFLNKFLWINDNLPEQRNQIISTNFTLFNNYDQKYECSAVFFEKAISFKPPEFDVKIGQLFDSLGMSKDDIQKLFAIGESLENVDAGTIFQFFDLSHQDPAGKNAYDMVDRLCYPCVKKGAPIYHPVALSDLYQGTFDSIFLSQYRLVANHTETLNPYGSLYIRRLDLNKPAVVEDYEKRLRKAIQKIPYDKVKAEQFKQHLMAKWGLQ